MRKLKIIIALVIVQSLSLMAIQVDSTAFAEQIIDSYLDAIGGREKLLMVIDETMVLKNLPGAPEVTLKIVKKIPNKYYQLLTTPAFTQEVIFDGEKGKTIEFGQELIFDEAENKRMAEQNNMHLFLKMKELGIATRFIGEEDVNGYNCYVIKFYLKYDLEWTLYIDKQSNYLIRQIIPIHTERGAFNQTLDFYDYENFDGYMYATRIRQLMGPQTVELKLQSVEVNTFVQDDLFEMN